METIQSRILHLIHEKALNIKTVSKTLNIPYTSLKSALEKSKNELNTKYCIRIAEVYNVNLNWLLLGQGPMFIGHVEPEKEGEKARLEALEKEIEEMRRKQDRLEGKNEAYREELDRCRNMIMASLSSPQPTIRKKKKAIPIQELKELIEEKAQEEPELEKKK